MNRKEFLFEIIDIKKEHGLQFDQVMYLLCSMEDIDFDLINAADVVALFNKGLIKKDGSLNMEVIYRNREEKTEVITEDTAEGKQPEFQKPNIKYPDSKAKLLSIWDKLVPNERKTESAVKKVADTYFKGDMEIAKYFTMFKALFPSKDQKANRLWNNHFGIVHTGITLWDAHVRVAKKFLEIYTKKEIAVFLTGLYLYIKDSISVDDAKCYATKPYKFLNAYQSWYEMAEEWFKSNAKNRTQVETTQEDNAEQIGESVVNTSASGTHL